MRAALLDKDECMGHAPDAFVFFAAAALIWQLVLSVNYYDQDCCV